mgnify:CR=1 FL=1
MDFKVIDNFLSDFDYQLALSIVEDDNTTWRCGEVIFEELLNCPIQFNRQFSHFINTEDKSTMYYLVLSPIMKILNIKDENIIRAKINSNLATENIIEHGFHVDTKIESKTIIYYFNTNNGYTLFENGGFLKIQICRFSRNPSPCGSFLDIGELFRTHPHKINSCLQTSKKKCFSLFPFVLGIFSLFPFWLGGVSLFPPPPPNLLSSFSWLYRYAFHIKSSLSLAIRQHCTHEVLAQV